MELKEAFEKGIPLVALISIENEPRMQRVIAEGFVVEGGVVFFDIGWYESSFHSMHFLKGKIKTGTSEWGVGGAVIVVLHKEDYNYGELVMWKDFKKTKLGKQATREIAKTFAEDSDYKIIE